MKSLTPLVFIAFVICFLSAGCLIADDSKSDVKKPDVVAEITCGRAVEMLKAEPKKTFLVDVRTRPEYQMIGHSEGAYNVPYMFWTGKFNGKKYGLDVNENFKKDLLERFNPKTDTLIITCRSGNRSLPAAAAAVEAGWPADRVFNLTDGFEGGKVKDPNSIYNGQRRLKGWRAEGFPWTYSLDKKLLYNSDLEAEK